MLPCGPELRANLAITSAVYGTRVIFRKITTGTVGSWLMMWSSMMLLSDKAARTSSAKDNRIYGVASAYQADYVVVSRCDAGNGLNTDPSLRATKLITSTTADR